ncbi:hypothetical protein BDN70DRAFT_829306, partial [Pholiota conissans]
MSNARQLRSSKPTKRRRQNLNASSRLSETSEPAEVSQPVNIQGLPCLADEIYLEIMSHLPAFPLPTDHNDEDIALYGDRRLALDALSQTCRSLRRVFLRYRWQRIEVYQRMSLGRKPLPKIRYKNQNLDQKAISNTKRYVVELLRQLETVTIREPALAELVNVMDIIVADYSPDTVLEELARCIALMPNLHTVQIYFDINNSHLTRRAFSTYIFPQIRTAYLSTNASFFLDHCPNI